MKRPKFRIFKTKNNDFLVKERNCLGWSHVIFDQEVVRRTSIPSIYWPKPIYFDNFGRAMELLKKHISRERYLRIIHNEDKIEKKKRKITQKIHFNYE